MGLTEKLSCIQQKMKAPKNLYNKFGNYTYRNAEGILEAFKPFESEYKVALTVSDDVVAIADRIYIKATAMIMDCEAQDSIAVTAFAREACDKKGMDDAQITGAASSYARKYALNGLFLLDDAKDPDTDEHTEGQKDETSTGRNNAAKEETRESLFEKIKAECKRTGVTAKMILQDFKGVKNVSDLTKEQMESTLKKLHDTADGAITQ